MEQPKWEWMDTIFGTILGVFGAVATMTGWTTRRFASVDDRHHQLRKEVDGQIDDLHARVTQLSEDVAALMAHHESDRERLQSIDKKLDRIEEFLRNLNRRQA